MSPILTICLLYLLYVSYTYFISPILTLCLLYLLYVSYTCFMSPILALSPILLYVSYTYFMSSILTLCLLYSLYGSYTYFMSTYVMSPIFKATHPTPQSAYYFCICSIIGHIWSHGAVAPSPMSPMSPMAAVLNPEIVLSKPKPETILKNINFVKIWLK